MATRSITEITVAMATPTVNFETFSADKGMKERPSKGKKYIYDSFFVVVVVVVKKKTESQSEKRGLVT